MTKARPARLKIAPTRRQNCRSSRACWTKTGTNAAVLTRADQQVVQDGRQRARQDEGVGTGGGAERRSDDDVAHQAEAAAEHVAGAMTAAAPTSAALRGDVATLVGAMALLARFACGCRLRVEIPAPPRVGCAEQAPWRS